MENTKSKSNHNVSQNQGSSVYGGFGQFQSGIAAQATAAFIQLAAIFSKISNEFGELFIDQTAFQQTAANSSANATVNNAKDQALSTTFNGVGSLVVSIGQFIGAGISLGSYSGGAPEDPNLNLANEYLKGIGEPNPEINEKGSNETVEEGASRNPSQPETVINEEEEPQNNKQIQERIKELAKIQDVEKELLTDADGMPIKEMPELDRQALKVLKDNTEGDPLSAKLQDYISNKAEARNAEINRAINKAQSYNQLFQGGGGALGALAGKPAEAYFQYAAGKEQALVTLANEGLSLSQNSAEQERNKADSFQQTASSEFDKLTQIRQAETSSQG